MHKHRDSGKGEHLGEFLAIQSCAVRKEDRMGKPTQEILKITDLDTEAPFIALQDQTNCCCNAFACLLALGRKALPQMEAD